PAGDPMLETLNQPLDFVFKVDVEGKIVALVNYRKLRKRLLTRMRPHARTPAQKRMLELMQARMKTEAGVRLMLAALPEAYFSSFVGEVFLHDTLEYATSLGGVPAAGRIVVSGYQPDSGRIRIVATVVPDVLDDRFIGWVRQKTGATGSVPVEVLNEFGRKLGLRDEKTVVYDVYARKVCGVHWVRSGRTSREEVVLHDVSP
ncbi:MAG: hypothetical protein RMM53_08670, partial [Bacteroidia bacterium]|nr:hypothetical protein [Bacteroidia bacterium]MDW8334272.1 hypothetical protein [Bacteroidia bacterium]